MKNKSFPKGAAVALLILLGLAFTTTQIDVSKAKNTLPCASMPALTGDTTSSAGSCATTTPHGISLTIGDPGGSALAAGSTTTDYVTVPFPCTIVAYNLVVNGGTITVKFWKKATGTAIPTSSDSISTSGVSISSGTAIHSTTLSDFTTTTISANDILAVNVSTVSGAKYLNAVLQCQ